MKLWVTKTQVSMKLCVTKTQDVTVSEACAGIFPGLERAQGLRALDALTEDPDSV